ncbi:BTAD domain-containing putative transcriptional regulator [Amycolatopsis anabasis]|uniref:nSTAND1 domain-containing NTPase n=1 Tax=Amycolatopsis anabasis TaxID=1840409 RepID=UPI00131E8F2D|nr:BTAD domain-containing putative transcriptional regulator [Amycolatopsis anabasis]
MEFRVLGPLEMWVDDRRVALGSAKQRCVLAVLLIGAGRPHPVESLIDRVWGEDPPTQVRGALYSYISRLRRILRDARTGPEIAIRQRGGCYLLDCPAERIDLHRFEALTRRARDVADAAERAELLHQALELWGGPPLQDLAGRWAEEIRESLRRQRVRVCAAWGQAMIDLGRYAEAGERLERELGESPLAEPLVGQLMVSLWRQGRPAEALATYAALHRRLDGELDVEPGPALQELHRRIRSAATPPAADLGFAPSWTPDSREVPAPAAEPVRSAPPERRVPAGEAPYLGLRTFQAEDAARFFGRQALLDELLGRLADQRFLAVFGPSGSGKSSLLRAGLLAAIRADRVPGFTGWTSVLLTPGEHPLRELAARLAAATGTPAAALHRNLTADPACLGPLLRGSGTTGSAALLLIDQFEEIFTLCADDQERAHFIEALLSVVNTPSVPARVVLGVRADFYPSCAEFPALIALLRDQQVLVGPMAEACLRAVIEEPARFAGLTVEPALVETVLADVLGEPAALPLISHALLETWRRRDGDVLTVGHYVRAGGVRGAIAQSADEVYAGLDPGQRAIAREVFLRLTVPGEGPEDTRRRAHRRELLGRADSGEVAEVLAHLADARLISLDEDTVTVTHESLIRGWPTLRNWINEDRELLRAHRRLTEHALEWDQHGRDEGMLYRGSRLALWRDRATDRLNDVERAFLTASRRHAERELTARRRRIHAALAGLGAALVVLLVLTSVALVQADRAARERNQARVGQLIADARNLLPLDPELSLALAGKAVEREPSEPAQAVLAQSLVESRVRATFTGHQGPVLGVDVSPDGARVAGAGADGTVRIWPVARDREPVVLTGHRGPALAVAFSPDGTRVASAGADGTVRVRRADGTGEPAILTGHQGAVAAVAFSPDGTRVASAGADGTVRVRTADGTGEPAILTGHAGKVLGVAFDPRGARVASSGADGTVRVWDPASARALAVRADPGGPVAAVAFSPDGGRVAAGGADGRIRIWPAADDGPPVVLWPHRDSVKSVAFGQDGQHVLSGGQDRTAHVVQAEDRGDAVVLRGHGGPIRAVAFGPGDRLAATAGDDGTVRLWDPSPKPGLRVLAGHPGAVQDVALSPDSRRLATAAEDGTALIHRIDGSAPAVPLRGHRGPVRGVAFGPGGRLVATAGDDGQVRVWDGDRPVTVLSGHKGPVWSVAFGPDGRIVASGGEDGTVRIRPIDGNGPETVLHTGGGAARDVAFSPDGARLAAADATGVVRVWSLPGSGAPRILPGADGMRTVAFSPDGAFLAGAGNDGTIRVWPSRGEGAPVLLTGHYSLVFGLAFSPDGQFLASVGNDAKVRLWRWATRREPVVFERHVPAPVTSVAFGADNLLTVGRGDGTTDAWTCEVCVPADRLSALARQRHPREPTPAERRQYLHDEP